MAYFDRDSRQLFHIYPYGCLNLEVVVASVCTKAEAMPIIMHPYAYNLAKMIAVPTAVRAITDWACSHTYSFSRFSTEVARCTYEQMLVTTTWVVNDTK